MRRLTDGKKLGEGAGSVGVYAGVDTRDGRPVAIKTVDRTREGSPPLSLSAHGAEELWSDRAPVLAAVDETWKHSFQRELDIAIKLAHPNVIELYDVIFWDRVRLLSLRSLPAVWMNPIGSGLADSARSVRRSAVCVPNHGVRERG